MMVLRIFSIFRSFRVIKIYISTYKKYVPQISCNKNYTYNYCVLNYFLISSFNFITLSKI